MGVNVPVLFSLKDRAVELLIVFAVRTVGFLGRNNVRLNLDADVLMLLRSRWRLVQRFKMLRFFLVRVSGF